MKNKGIILSLVILTFFFSGCSWLETFILKNNLDTDVMVTYELDRQSKTHGIFRSKPTAYSLDNSGEINWNKNINCIDIDTSVYNIQIILPANSALDLGSLDNSEYISSKENESDFNLITMSFEFNNQLLEIDSENFDTYFKKRENGNIEYTIQKAK